MSNKKSNGKCLGYVAFKCHTNFQFNWESFAHKDQQKKKKKKKKKKKFSIWCPLEHGGYKCQASVCGLVPL
jgi:hypothetical protein